MTYKEELQPVELPPNIPLLDTKLVESYEQGYALSKGRKKTTFWMMQIMMTKSGFFTILMVSLISASQSRNESYSGKQ